MSKIIGFFVITAPCFIAQIRGLDASLFQNPAKLHLTIGTLRLYSNKEEVSTQLRVYVLMYIRLRT